MTHLLAATGLLLVATLGQTLLAPALASLGVRPDLPLIVVLAWAMLRGSNEGAAVGFIAGILLDSVSYTPFGVNSALMGILGYCVGLAETNLYRGNLPFFFATGVAATLLYHAAMFLVLQAMGLTMPPILAVLQVAGPAALANALLIAPVFLLCRRVVRTIAGWRQLRL